MEPERISFPADYPIKVVARASDGLRSRVDAVFSRHFGPFEPERVTERPSARNNFVSVTYLMRVEAEAQLGALHAELRTHPDIMMVL